MAPGFDEEAYRAAEHAGYEAVAADYDRWLARATAQFAEPLLDLVPFAAGQRVLDAATGPGVLVPRVLQRVRPGGSCVGVDFSARMIQLARTNAGNARGAHFQVMDVERLEFSDGMFDVVVCGFGLMHFPSAGKALAEFRRVLKPGGALALSVWSELPKVEFMAIVLNGLKELDPGASFPPGPPMFGFGSEAVLAPLLAAAGFGAPRVAEHRAELWFPGFEAYWNALILGAARLGGVVRALPAARQEELKERLRAATAARAGAQGLALGGSAFLAAAMVG
jgi:ubiquinone/menaquinone biosynthesis C-methylase UbiE